MNIGMLWKDNNPDLSVEQRVRAAARYYRSKYGQTPNLCFVHPSQATEEMVKNGVSNGETIIEIRPNNSVKPNHMWVGVNDMEKGIWEDL